MSLSKPYDAVHLYTLFLLQIYSQELACGLLVRWLKWNLLPDYYAIVSLLKPYDAAGLHTLSILQIYSQELACGLLVRWLKWNLLPDYYAITPLWKPNPCSAFAHTVHPAHLRQPITSSWTHLTISWQHASNLSVTQRNSEPIGTYYSDSLFVSRRNLLVGGIKLLWGLWEAHVWLATNANPHEDTC